MGNLIPFFRYDLLARIVPGAFTLSTLAYVGAEVPLAWSVMFEADPSAGAIPGSAVVVPLIYAGACYAVGLFYEVAFATLPLMWLRDAITKKAYGRAKERRKSDARDASSDQVVRYKLWNDLVHEDAKEGERFAHAHRFQAEARMCLHSVIPALMLAIYSCVNWYGGGRSQQRWEFGLAILLLIVLSCGAYGREWRRWIQVLNADEYRQRVEAEAKPKTDG